MANSTDVLRMEKSLRKALDPRTLPTTQSVQQPQPKPRGILSKLRGVGNYKIAWVKRVVVNWELDSISWQAWLGMMMAYAAIAVLRSRSGNDKPISRAHTD